MTNTRTITQYSTIAAWAAATGSKAKTHAGQRKAILASFPTTFRPESPTHIPSSDAASYLARRERSRQERFAASHPLTLSHPRPATIADVQGVRWSTFNHPQVALSDLRPEMPTYALVGGWCIRVVEDATYDYDYYTRSCGHAKKTVTSRTVLIRRVAKDGTLDKRDVEVASFRGNYVLDALVASEIAWPQLKKSERQEGCLFVRLHAAYNAKLVRKGTRISIYERTLLGDHVDYCAVAHGVAYHDATQSAAIFGLRSKLRAKIVRASGGLIDYALCKRLGFCDAGLESFAQAFELDLRSRYTAEQISERVQSDIPAARPYRSELHTLAHAVKYEILA